MLEEGHHSEVRRVRGIGERTEDDGAHLLSPSKGISAALPIPY